MNLLLEQSRNIIRSLSYHHDTNINIEKPMFPILNEYRKMQANRDRLLKQLNFKYKYYINVKNGLPWPTIAFKIAVNYCMSLPIRIYQPLLAVCLKQACLEGAEFSPTEKELCELMQISEIELSNGIHSVNNLKTSGQINFKNIDFVHCEISSMFARLYLHSEAQLKEHVYEFIQKTSCIRSNIRIKVAGATYAILWVAYPRCFTLERMCSLRNASEPAVRMFLKKAVALYPPV